jgi:virginiamycin A acetyltransferase
VLTIRTLFRDALVFAGTVPLAPLWLLAVLERWCRSGDGFFLLCSEVLSLIPGKPGVFLRRSFYAMTLDAFARDCHVGFGTTLAHPQVSIRGGVWIGSRCTLGKVEIDEHVTIGSNVDILSGRHQHGFGRVGMPIQQQGGSYRQLRLGRNTWIGNSSVIMADVGPESVIGAGSVVVREIPERSVAAGNPAVVKKVRP